MGSLVGDRRRWPHLYMLCHSNQKGEMKDTGVDSHQKLYLITLELRITMRDIECIMVGFSRFHQWIVSGESLDFRRGWTREAEGG